MKNKFRKLFGITLMGWLLMAPPIRDGQVQLGWPIPLWTQHSAYDSAQACQHDLDYMQMFMLRVTPEQQQQIHEYAMRQYGHALSLEETQKRFAYSKCVSADDPRLTQ